MSDYLSPWKHYLAGSLSGFSQTIVGHPLDTVKVWSQNSQLQNQIKNEITPRKLYRGLPYPLFSSGLITSLSFGITNNFYKHNHNYFASGFAGGVVGGIISTPLDYYKIQKQTHNLHARDIWKNIKISKMGWNSSIIREGFGCATYFSIYYYQREHNISPFIAGGFAGLSSWTATYPIDTVKTRIQSGDYNFKGALQKGNYWKGFSWCATRAWIVNAVGWYVYEKTSKWF